jgi:4-hydroxyphenylacetate 3-monooxygenase/anthranilate 3-monooxygenase (FAD)/4-hydroxyphenylacetate 3-monooxygenase
MSTTFLVPKSSEDLKKRRRMTEILTAECAGQLDRGPEFVPSLLIGLAEQRDAIAKIKPMYAENLVNYLDYIRDNDLALCNVFTDPSIDRSKPPRLQEDPDRYLHVVKRTDQGVVVRGAKPAATGASQANEIAVHTIWPLTQEERDYAVIFATPIANPGLKFVLREPAGAGRSTFDRPVSSRFDELDALAIFDDVFVPWDRVFVAGEIELIDILRAATFSMAAHPLLIKTAVRAEIILGIGCMLAEYSGHTKTPGVQALLHELAVISETLKALIVAAEAEPAFTKRGVALPKQSTITAGRAYGIENFPKAIHILQELSGPAVVFAPTEKDFECAALRPYIDKYYCGPTVPAVDKARLLKLAWEFAGDSFGGRQTFVQIFQGGTLHLNKMMAFVHSDKQKATALAKKAAGIG